MQQPPIPLLEQRRYVAKLLDDKPTTEREEAIDSKKVVIGELNNSEFHPNLFIKNNLLYFNIFKNSYGVF